MRKAILAIALLSVFSAPVLLAQTTNNARQRPSIATMVQHEVTRLTTLLTFTPGEVTSLTELLTNNATSDQALMASRRTAEKALRTAETANDSAGIQAASAQLGTISGQMTANRATLNAGIAQILTSQQLAIYKALGHGGFRGGRGGFGGGPGGFGGAQ
jgi:hypothetical protein